jgi:hypothetical protein
MNENHFRRFWLMLAQRTPRSLKALHYLVHEATGETLCLDLNIRGASIEHVHAAAAAWLDAAPEDAILPHAPAADWRRLEAQGDPRNGVTSAIFSWKRGHVRARGRFIQVAIEREPR